ncbi:Ohr family peroxiredoxin [Streptomyces sp. NPDC049040]|uniref:Ohr family peroxiredoxin n=1 Tax=Streptomyces sp. NPDC049040 TaxID=3365593 RepID=UPI00371C4EA6
MKPTYTAVATSSGRNGRAVTSDGLLDLQLAMPKELGGTGEGANPEQLFAAGYAACFAASLELVARGRKSDVEGLSVTAEVSLVPKSEGPGFTLASVLRIALPAHLAGAEGAALVEAAHQVCPYSSATRGNMPVELVVAAA